MEEATEAPPPPRLDRFPVTIVPTGAGVVKTEVYPVAVETNCLAIVFVPSPESLRVSHCEGKLARNIGA